MTRNFFLMTAVLTILQVSGEEPSRAKGNPHPPNMLVVVVDDLGYGDIGRHGNRAVRTPVLDKLGEESMRLEPFYASPVCATTRASLLTGRDFWRTGVWGVHSGRDYLRLDERTIAQAMRDGGYRTGFIGKWHNGKHAPWLPWNRGFDHAWVAELYQQQNALISHNGRSARAKGWTTDQLSQLALEFIGEKHDKPFFLLLSYLAPHEPWEAPDEMVARYAAQGHSRSMATLLAMIEQLDTGIGKVLDGLREYGLESDTMVVFLSDNGPIGQSGGLPPLTDGEMAVRNPMGWRGVKGNPWENGQRAPCWIRRTGVLKPGDMPMPCRVTDLFPTLLAAAGIPSNTKGSLPLDGRNLWPAMVSGHPVDVGDGFPLPYWQAQWPEQDSGALQDPAGLKAADQIIGWREGPWKWLRAYGKDQLFQLAEDAGETRDRAPGESHTSDVMSLRADTWFSRLQGGHRAFGVPAFPVGPVGERMDEFSEVHNVGHVPGYSAVRVAGGVKALTHESTGWHSPGDAQVIRVDVKKSGAYRVRLECREPEQDSELRLRIANEELVGPPVGWLGTINLQAGVAEMELQVTRAGTSGVMAALEGVRFEWVGE